jgi:hypothetical protein
VSRKNRRVPPNLQCLFLPSFGNKSYLPHVLGEYSVNVPAVMEIYRTCLVAAALLVECWEQY